MTGSILCLDLATQTGWCEGIPGQRPTSGTMRLAPPGARNAECYDSLNQFLDDRLRLKVRGFSEDGWRVIEDADDCLIDSPDVADAVKIDATHPDGGQSWSEDASNVPGSGSIENLTVLNVLFREWIGPAGHPLRRTDMQGIGFHNGTYRNLTIRGGEVWVGGWNGVRVTRVTGGVIEGVKVLDPARKTLDRRIHVVGSTGVAVRNCTAGRVIIGQTDMTAAQMAAAGIVKPDYATLPAMSLVD